MIIVNIKNSYPDVIKSAGVVGMVYNVAGLVSHLENITLGDWPKIKRENVMPYLDVVCGTHEGRIVTAFPSAGFDYVGEENRIVFHSSLASDDLGKWSRHWAWIIGVPMPGGPWRVGESRGTRRIDTEAYLRGEGAPYVNRPAPDDVQTAMAEMAAFTYGLPVGDAFTPLDPPREAMPSPVDVLTLPTGEVRITVRAGTRFTLTVK